MLSTRRNLLIGLTLAPVVAGFPGQVRARPQSSAEASQAALEAALAEHQAPAMAAGVVGRDGIIWSGAAGIRKEGEAVPVTSSDLWHFGSNGKAMTAMLYARLVDQGRAEWNVPIADLFSGDTVDPVIGAVTIDDLLCHRSGLMDRDVMGREFFLASASDQRPAREQREDFARSAVAKPPTGQKGAFLYANANYVLAGAAIERLLNTSWEEAIKAQVFEPLGMTTVGHGAPLGDNPWGHTALGATPGPVDPTRMSDNPLATGPAGRLHMSAQDYAAFLRVYLNHGEEMVARATFDRLITPRFEEPHYVYGWGRSADREWARGPVLSHDGSNMRWHATASVAPARGLAVFCVANDRARGQPAARALLQQLIDIHAV